MMRASFARATATIAASTTFPMASEWPASNVLDPFRPHLRTYSADLTAKRITLDMATATSLAVIWIAHANFTTCTIQGHATDTWGSPTYTSGALTLVRSGTGRYHYAHRPTVAVPFNLRYLSLSVPNQATTDGASVFRLGVFTPWPLIVSPPRDVRLGIKPSKPHPREDTKTPDGRTVDRLILDDPIRRVRATRQAMNQTEMDAWEEFDRQWGEAPGQAALVLWRDTVPQESYFMRREDVEEWTDVVLGSESDIECVEITSG